MAYLLNSIAQFNFIALEGEYDPEAPSLAIDSRAGVDGLEFTLLGGKGQPFSMASLVDCDTIAAAKQLVKDYKALIALGSVGLWKNGEVHINVKVLNVVPLRVSKISTAIGNKKSALAGALLECRWDLVANV